MLRRNLASYRPCQVFLNYPFDQDFEPMANAMSFAVVAAGLLPVCARDLSTPDRPRLEAIVDAIVHSDYSAHDLSRFTGEGASNHARMNMPIEMGMAVFHALNSQRRDHRCAFFVPTPYDYQRFASDLAGLDPKCHDNSDERMVAEMYEWLRGVVPDRMMNSRPTVQIVGKFCEFKTQLGMVLGSGAAGRPTHQETREVMYGLCALSGWWKWREIPMSKEEFPEIPIAWRNGSSPW